MCIDTKQISLARESQSPHIQTRAPTCIVFLEGPHAQTSLFFRGTLGDSQSAVVTARPTFVQSAPSSDVRRRADKVRVVLRHTDRDDVRLEADRLVEPQKSQVVLEGPRIELRMRGDDLHPPLLIAVRFVFQGQVVFSQSQEKITGCHAKQEIKLSEPRRDCQLKKYHLLHYTPLSLVSISNMMNYQQMDVLIADNKVGFNLNEKSRSINIFKPVRINILTY